MLPDLTDDCDSCAALCCVAYPFDKGDEFAIDKSVNAPCQNLDCNNRCTIHASLLQNGFSGCVAYSCAGAGQRVTQSIFKGQDWQTNPALRSEMTHCLRVLRPIHEALSLLREARQLPLPASLYAHGDRLTQALCPDDDTSICAFEADDVQDALAEVPIFLQSLATFV